MTDADLQATRARCLEAVATLSRVLDIPGDDPHWRDIQQDAANAVEDAKEKLALLDEIERLRKLTEPMPCGHPRCCEREGPQDGNFWCWVCEGVKEHEDDYLWDQRERE